MKKIYRKGPLGALMDEYEKAMEEYKIKIAQLSDADFVKIVDPNTEDPDCRSAQTICQHVIASGYGYANYIRSRFNQPIELKHYELSPETATQTCEELDKMIGYTVATLEDKWDIPDAKLGNYLIKSRWGTIYDVEQLLEHAVLHVLRHRRQIERLYEM